jgi:hypothetical protein
LNGIPAGKLFKLALGTQRQRLQILCAVGEDVDHSSCSGTQPIELTVGRAET